MSRGTLALALGIAFCASCFPPGASGPGFRWAPPQVRGPHWDELVARLHATLTVVDEYHGTRVYVVHLPEERITQVYVPMVDAVDACSIPGSDAAYVLLKDGRIVNTMEGQGAEPVFQVEGGAELGSAIALSPDGTTIALLHPLGNDHRDDLGHHRLTLIDLAHARASDLPGEFLCFRPCWAPDGKSLFATDSAGTIIRCSLRPDDPASRIGQGCAPVLAQDGNSLLFRTAPSGSREWTGIAWRTSWTYLRSAIGTTKDSDALPVRMSAGGEVIALGADGLVVHGSEPDERLPLEHSGFLMRGPYWRGGISVFDPASGSSEPLFLGIAPTSIQWRWD